MQSQTVLAGLDRLIQSRSILNHPFYQAWNAGELTSDQLTSYAKIYYRHVEAFPGYLKSTAALASDPAVRAELEDNLKDELTTPEPHPKMWLDFAEGVGCDRAEIADGEPSAAAAGIVETFGRLSRSSAAEGLAALYAYESQQPEVAATKAKGLRGLYGIEDKKTLAYFDVHAEADVRHSAGEREAIGRCLEEGASEEAVINAAGDALDAYWGLLDGVCEEVGISTAAC